jgi:hypothetical protein
MLQGLLYRSTRALPPLLLLPPTPPPHFVFVPNTAVVLD